MVACARWSLTRGESIWRFNFNGLTITRFQSPDAFQGTERSDQGNELGSTLAKAHKNMNLSRKIHTLYWSPPQTSVAQVSPLLDTNLWRRFRKGADVKVISSFKKHTAMLLPYILIDDAQICQRGSTRAVLRYHHCVWHTVGHWEGRV